MKDNKPKKDRVLTKKEQERLEKIQVLTEQKTAEGYRRTDLTVSVVYANVMAFILCIPLCLLFGVAFAWMRRDAFSLDLGGLFWLFPVAVLISVVLHELIHGLFWGLFSKGHFQSIEFGFIKEYGTPYCTCLEPLSKTQYLVGSVMPGVLFGILPMTVSLFTGSFWLFAYGVVMTFAAGGDFTILLKLLRYRAEGQELLCVDHPTECGLMVLER